MIMKTFIVQHSMIIHTYIIFLTSVGELEPMSQAFLEEANIFLKR